MALKFLDFFLDLLFPISCIGCGGGKNWLCEKCLAGIKIETKNHDINGLDAAWSFATYHQPLVEKSIRVFKFKFVFGLSSILAEIMAQELSPLHQSMRIDYVVGVPLSGKRLNWRGFNQADMLALHIAERLGIDCLDSRLIFKRQDSLTQVGLSRTRRLNNLKDKITVIGHDKVAGKNILLIDDVLTTGATLSECALSLKRSNVNNIFAAVLAAG